MESWALLQVFLALDFSASVALFGRIAPGRAPTCGGQLLARLRHGADKPHDASNYEREDDNSKRD